VGVSFVSVDKILIPNPIDRESDQPAAASTSQSSALSAVLKVWDGFNWIWTHSKVPYYIGNLLPRSTLLSTGRATILEHQDETASAQICLEQNLEAQVFQLVDINQRVEFNTFLYPNECNVFKVKEHLDLQEKIGIIVSTGTERSFFDLALCNLEKCKGLVVRDINPKVKAYVDFNILLLRLALDVKDYERLSDDLMSFSDLTKWVEASDLPSGDIKYYIENPKMIDLHLYENADLKLKKNEALLSRIHSIRDRIERSSLPPNIRHYYLHHLADFASVYFGVNKNWRGRDKSLFHGVQYHENPEIFNKLQQFAKSGNIVATIGDINDLRFLDKLSVGIIDVSNIPDYILLDLKGGKDFSPRIIWTYLYPGGADTNYYSCAFPSSLRSEQRVEFEQLLKEMRQARCIEKELVLFGGPKKLGVDLFLTLMKLSKGNTDIWPASYSSGILNKMKEFKDTWMLKIPRIGWVSFDSSNFDPKQINAASIDEIKIACQNPRIVRFLPQIVANWSAIDFDQYVAFSDIPGWKEEFLRTADKLARDLDCPWRNEVFLKKFGPFLTALR
jgi:hypothetical protein